MQPEAYTIGVSEFTTWPWTFEHDVERYPQHGIDCIEITEFKLDPHRYAEQLAQIPAAGLGVSSVQALIHALYPTKLQPEPTAPADRLRHIRNSIERIAPHVPGGTPFVVITGAPPGGDVRSVLATSAAEFGELARFAEAHGVRVALEPLNPTLMNVDSSVWSLGDALRIVEQVDHPAFGVCVDAWNIWQSPNLLETVRGAGDRIFVVQVSDWGAPREYYDRLVPGDGELPRVPLVDAIAGSGFTGAYVVEIFSSESVPGSLWLTDLDALLERSFLGFDKIWHAAVALRHPAD